MGGQGVGVQAGQVWVAGTRQKVWGVAVGVAVERGRQRLLTRLVLRRVTRQARYEPMGRTRQRKRGQSKRCGSRHPGKVN